MAKPFTRLTAQGFNSTLARKFIPLSDQLRDLLTRFGLRSYAVRMVKTRWTGARRGVGVETVESEVLLEPTPRISDLSGLTETLQPVGLDELGVLTLSHISGRYTEDQLRGFGEGGEPPDPNQQFYYEVEFFKSDGGSVRRRFFIRGTPNYFPGRLYWTLRLERAHEDRDRSNGDPR